MTGRNAKKKRGLLHFPWHVISLAAFPAIFLYANNMESLVTTHALAPLVFSLAGVGVLWILSRQILPDSLRAGLAVSFFILLFFPAAWFFRPWKAGGGSFPDKPSASPRPFSSGSPGYTIWEEPNATFATSPPSLISRRRRWCFQAWSGFHPLTSGGGSVFLANRIQSRPRKAHREPSRIPRRISTSSSSMNTLTRRR